jgi:hypothetical protein
MIKFGTSVVGLARQSRREISLRKKHTEIIPPAVPHTYSYNTPPTGIVPVNGEIIHADNLLNKLAVNWQDLDGNLIEDGIKQLTTGDFVAIGSTVYTVIAPVQNDAGFSYITIEPELQKQDAVYPVRAWRDS